MLQNSEGRSAMLSTDHHPQRALSSSMAPFALLDYDDNVVLSRAMRETDGGGGVVTSLW